MAKYTGNVLTNLGKDLLARAIIGGEALTFTKVELGKGVPNVDCEELTGLVESFKVLAITSTAKLEGGSYRVRTAFSNSGITEDTYLREIGVFARGEDGIEILYSYCYTDTPDLIPAEGAGVLERVEDVITYISNAANVNAVIDQSKVYATIKDLIEGLAGKENKFDKKSGFNLNKTDSAETDSSILVATAKAVKKAWDKVLEAIGFTNTNKAAILNNTEQIENLSEYIPSVFTPTDGVTLLANYSKYNPNNGKVYLYISFTGINGIVNSTPKHIGNFEGITLPRNITFCGANQSDGTSPVIVKLIKGAGYSEVHVSSDKADDNLGTHKDLIATFFYK